MTSSLFTDHLPLFVLLATLLSAFLSLLWKDDTRERRRFFVRLWLGLVGGSLLVAWCMHPFPG
ncbi:MAG: hypothetical protein ABIT01_15480 [Thermoanaerobaculia bacterium]